MNLGCHLSVGRGYEHMGKEALSIGADTFQFFSRNPRGGKAKAIDPVDAEKLDELMKSNNFGPILAHAPYTLNMCSKTEKTRAFAKMCLEEDLKRMELLPCSLYNFHPGSHTGQGLEIGIGQIISTLNEVITEDMTTMILLESMSGKGTEVGSRFEELHQIIDGMHFKEKMGVCIDTCHIHSAGYDIVNDLDGVLEEFDRIVGIDRIKAVHLNDNMNEFDCHKDRHAKIGEGSIGLEALVRFISHPKLRHLPYFLETPNELEGYKKEIELLCSKIS